jgi:hypothetical protein
MVLKNRVIGRNKNTGDGKGKYKDHKSYKNPAGKV